MTAELRHALQQQHGRAGFRCRLGRAQARRAAADDTNVGEQVLYRGVSFRQASDVNATISREVPDQSLEDRPDPARFVKALVVEANGQQPVQTVEQAQRVEL